MEWDDFDKDMLGGDYTEAAGAVGTDGGRGDAWGGHAAGIPEYREEGASTQIGGPGGVGPENDGYGGSDLDGIMGAIGPKGVHYYMPCDLMLVDVGNHTQDAATAWSAYLWAVIRYGAGSSQASSARGAYLRHVGYLADAKARMKDCIKQNGWGSLL